MKKLTIKAAICTSVLLMGMSSCSTIHRTMAEPNSFVEFKKDDFTFSEQLTGKGSTVRVLGIDWTRLFGGRKTGNVGNDASVAIANIPVVGGLLGDRTTGYSLYNLMEENPGYDVVFYPQYKTKVSRPFLGIGLIFKKTTVETTARLGKIK